jgi:hypothetical protein
MNDSNLLKALVKNYIPLKGDCKSGLRKNYQNTLSSIQDNTNIIADINKKINYDHISEQDKCTLLNIKNDLEFCKKNNTTENNTTGGRRRKTRRNKKKSMKKKRRHTRKY